jgi:SAM-dependent methyltransferase
MASQLRMAVRQIKAHSANLFLRFDPVFRIYLKLKYGAKRPTGIPEVRCENAPLRSREQWKRATATMLDLHLVTHSDSPKNWDTLAALATILKQGTPDSHVLDAGAEFQSALLPCLYLYGYRHLLGINLIFKKSYRRGNILYKFGDITRTDLKPDTFDFVTCLSVIEHGVELEEFFREMARLLRPGGTLIVSTDYFPTPIDTSGLHAYGNPIHIFTRQEIERAVELAGRFGLELNDSIQFDCTERPVTWKAFNLNFTFYYFTLKKRAVR